MRLLPALALLAWANALAHARGERLGHDDTDCLDSRKNPEPRGVSALWDDDICPQSTAGALYDEARDHGLFQRWRQWVRRADPTTNAAAAQPTADDNKDDSKESDDAKAPAETKAAETKDAEPTNEPAETKEEPTEEEKPTEAEKTTEVKETKEAETTQKEETKEEESTIEQPTVPSVTVPSPTLPTQTLPTQETESEDSETTDPASTEESSESFSSAAQTTYSSYSSSRIGASCFTTQVEHTTVCSTRTRNGQKETHGCVAANLTSSACAPGMMCTIHPDSGNDVCMRLHNEVGTAGIVIASLFGALGAACTFTMVFICYQDKRAAKKFMNRRPPKTSESTRLLPKAAPASPPASPPS